MANKKGGRELIDTGTDKRYVRRDEKGQFKESDDVGKNGDQKRSDAHHSTLKAWQKTYENRGKEGRH